jgi:hypothetical protein
MPYLKEDLIFYVMKRNTVHQKLLKFLILDDKSIFLRCEMVGQHIYKYWKLVKLVLPNSFNFDKKSS